MIDLFIFDVDKIMIEIGLLPSYQENGDSSLIFMMDTLIKISENVNSGFYGNNFEKLHNIIANNEKKNIKTIVVGVTYALLDFANKFPLELKSTTIIETCDFFNFLIY